MTTRQGGTARWLQLHGVVSKQHVEAIEDALHNNGAVSVTLRDNADVPVLEPGVGETPLWPTVLVTALFDSDGHTSPALPPAIATLIDVLSQDFNASDWQQELLEHQDW